MVLSPPFSRFAIRIGIGTFLAGSIFAGPLTLTVGPGGTPTIIESPQANGTVTFTVTNPNAGTYILDYALAVINGPNGDDILTFGGVSFPTLFPTNVPQVFTYTVLNNGDPTDFDNGLNTVSFYIEASRASNLSAPQFLKVTGLGVFVFNANGGSQGTGPTQQTLNDLMACTAAPGALPDPCAAVKLDPDLYVDGVFTARGLNPSAFQVNLIDSPEPATAGSLAAGLLLLGWTLKRRKI